MRQKRTKQWYKIQETPNGVSAMLLEIYEGFLFCVLFACLLFVVVLFFCFAFLFFVFVFFFCFVLFFVDLSNIHAEL